LGQEAGCPAIDGQGWIELQLFGMQGSGYP
jgi:hypothetical protein